MSKLKWSAFVFLALIAGLLAINSEMPDAIFCVIPGLLVYRNTKQSTHNA